MAGGDDMTLKDERYWSDVPKCDMARVHPYSGTWVITEGVEGCGKDLLWQNLKPWLRSVLPSRRGLFETYEPWDRGDLGIIGRDIRNVLRVKIQVSAEFIQTAFIHNRHQHLVGRVLPALGRGDFVWQQRGYPSTFAYALAGGLPVAWTDEMHKRILGHNYFLPDLMIFLKIRADTSLERTKKDTPTFAIEYSRLEKVQKLVDAYDLVAEYFSPIAVVVDAEQPPEKVAEAVRSVLIERFFTARKLSAD